uniref:Uncharacterized protein n=1 Tax=Oryza rufipogon TaxID=4529 RepID=A0A0E0RC78_ORYRU
MTVLGKGLSGSAIVTMYTQGDYTACHNQRLQTYRDYSITSYNRFFLAVNKRKHLCRSCHMNDNDDDDLLMQRETKRRQVGKRHGRCDAKMCDSLEHSRPSSNIDIRKLLLLPVEEDPNDVTHSNTAGLAQIST